ncbi:MAG: cytochrome c biogenesis protein CcdA [Rikenellaceae bacterium]
MKKLILSTLLFLIGTSTALAQMPENPVKWSYEMEGSELHITATAPAPWHIYDLGPYEYGPNATVFTFTLPQGVELAGEMVELDKPVREMDPIFEFEIGCYGETARFTQNFVNNSGSDAVVTGTVEWQACDDSSCIAPEEYEFTFTVPASAEVTSTSTTDSSSKSLWSVIIEAILWGFAALLTPCVFPMVPMTVSFFIKGSGTKARGRFLAMVYGISIIALYTLPIAVIIGISYFGGGEAVTADIFNWLATHWVPNVLFFLIFMVFAASFFGAFEITMPSKLVNNSDRASEKGGLLGVFFMALTLVLVSFSCTGPIVGTIIVKSTQGEIWEPIITMLAFSTAFALPFTLFALFPSLLKNLPKSGGWLNSVKVVLGFLELALGLKFLSVADQTYHWGLLDREVYLALWIVIFTLLGLYLLGKLRFAHDSKMETVSVKRLFLAIISFAFVVYMLPGMWGAPLKALSGYMPPLATQDFVMNQQSAALPANTLQLESGKPKFSEFLHLPHSLQGFFDFEEGMEYAKKVGKPVFLDFTGHGCVNCREMEANVWSDPAVLSILNNDYVIIALYVDDKKELPESDWVTDSKGRVRKTIGKINASWQIERFGINAQPYYVILDPSTDVVLTDPRAYDLNVEGFVAFLQDGLKAFGEK